jgi:hypothetical protein
MFSYSKFFCEKVFKLGNKALKEVNPISYFIAFMDPLFSKLFLKLVRIM